MKKCSDRKPRGLAALAQACIALVCGTLMITGFAWPARARASGFNVFDGQKVVAITYDGQAAVPIRKAAALLSHDLTRLTPSLHWIPA